MPLTPRLQLFYPLVSDDPDVPDDMRKLALSVEGAAIGWVAGDFKYSFQAADHDNFILCDGIARNRAGLPAAYLALIDATMGAHPDPTKVRTPNGKRRSLMGADPGGATIFAAGGGIVPNLGNLAGEELHQLLALESGVNPNGVTAAGGSHIHSFQGHLEGGPAGGLNAPLFRPNVSLTATFWDVVAVGNHSHPLSSRLADVAHNTVHPVLFANLFIATGGGGSGVGGSGGGGLSAPADIPLVTGNLAASGGESGILNLGAGYRVLRVTSNNPGARIRLYSTPAKRDTDVARPISTDPPDYPTPLAAPNHGVAMEIVPADLQAGSYIQDLAPNIVGSSGEAPRLNDIAYRVDNLDTVAHVFNLNFTIQKLEEV